jgi:hypothetical protein
MSEKIDQFCDDLRDRLNAVDDRLQTMKASVESANAETKAAVLAKVNEAGAKVEARKREVETARKNVGAHLETKKLETKDKIEEWKRNREVKQLTSRAERAEEYANWAAVLAMDAVDEAHLASASSHPETTVFKL